MSGESRTYRRFIDTGPATIGRLSRGITPDRRLTAAERRCLAVAAAAPTHLLTLNSRGLTREELCSAWARFRKRLQRRRGKPLVFFSAVARSVGGGGFHLHVLLWDYLHAPVLHGLARDAGFGSPNIEQIGPTVEDILYATTYVHGQTEAVFNSEHHLRHQDRETSSRRFSRTSDRLLEQENPQLLSALKAAEDRSVSDLDLVEMIPKFISSREPDGGSSTDGQGSGS